MNYGRQRVELEVDEDRLIATHPPPRALPSPGAAVGAALDSPVEYPALRRGLTPDDHVVVVLDEQLPRLIELLVAVLEHITAAGVAPEAITLLFSGPGDLSLTERLPEPFRGASIEVADPADRQRLSYLATMRGGRRLYLNRTLVDADQVVVLSGCRYDALLGHAGAEGAIYPALSDHTTHEAYLKGLGVGQADAGPWPAHDEAVEASWLLGAPFFVQVIEAAGDEVAAIVAGAAQASVEASRQLNAAWRQEVPRPADLVIASLSGDPAKHTFAHLAAAASAAVSVVRPDGRIVLLSQANPDLGAAAALRDHEDAAAAVAALHHRPSPENLDALRWARAASRAHIALLSELPADAVEELFATPLDNAAQVQRLVNGAASCLFLADAHKSRAVLKESLALQGQP